MVLLVRIICLAGLLCVWAPFSSFNQAIAAADDVSGTDKAYLYKHPRQGYFVGVPQNVVLQDRGDKQGIILKSRKGYQITVQSAASNTQMDTLDMLYRMEAKYLGNGKPWSRKFEQAEIQVAGLGGVQAFYEGAGVRARVIIVRGPKLDYVFVFLASPLNFQKLVTEFDWVLANFRTAQGDDTNPQVMANSDKAVNVFKEPGLGFSVRYPAKWIAERQGDHAVVISGKSGTPAYFATVSLQNIKNPDGQTDPGGAVSAALRELKSQILSTDRHARFSGEGPFIYGKAGITLHGGQFTVTYDQQKTGYKQWTIVVPRPDEDIVHVWSYAAPIEQFLKFGAIAGSILDSWSIEPGQ